MIDEHGQPIAAARRESGRPWPGGPGSGSPASSRRKSISGNPLRCSAVTMRTAAHRERRGLRPRVSLRGRLGVLASGLAEMEGGLAGEADRSGSLAYRQRDPSLQGRHRPILTRQRGSWSSSSRSIGRIAPTSRACAKGANARLGRAFLNRALDALHAGRPELARDALHRGLKQSPAVIRAILRDPRLAVQMAALAAAPRLAARLFARGA